MSEKETAAEFNDHFRTILDALHDGELVFFLGAGVNRADRPRDRSWQKGEFLPDGTELANFLADKFHYPTDDLVNLTRVAQYVDTMRGPAKLYKELHQLLDIDYPITEIHRFLAGLPQRMRDKGNKKPFQLIVTTNYDDLIERAFKDANEEVDVVFYMNQSQFRGKLNRWENKDKLVSIENDRNPSGKFIHRMPNGELVLIESGNEYGHVSLAKRPIILKIHGAVDRCETDSVDGDSFVITEDNYIDYLSLGDVSKLIPIQIIKALRNSHLLFLGYGLKDWNLRVFLNNLWRWEKLGYVSWAIQRNPADVDKESWSHRNVKIMDKELSDYIRELDARI